ncbi:FliM/FliN family flagellar motor switch protein [Roseiconus nitratireducens]|uniref:FliM/FliN family flagellar motor switch protein n=1 Tax=Roseiconus nitratireducens TaxID=2605748 RepID=A0A5M6DGK6_9BACT|nr:FliM/FliN family flagellar motor C-terminal domain-containing protein [Roseiconus nitratireducens]KAA5544365.1 FliM/FliN family flagellar motor switch protein [Roseiconus nitratireducens]
MITPTGHRTPSDPTEPPSEPPGGTMTAPTRDDAVGSVSNRPATFEELPASTPCGEGVSLEVRVRLGEFDLTLDRLLDLRVGDVIELDQRVGAPVRLYVAGQLFAIGELVRLEDALDVRLLHLLTD